MPQMKDKRRTLLGWTGGAAVVVLGALAVAAPVTRVDNGNRAVVVSAHGDFTAPRETLDAVKWLFAIKMYPTNYSGESPIAPKPRTEPSSCTTKAPMPGFSAQKRVIAASSVVGA